MLLDPRRSIVGKPLERIMASEALRSRYQEFDALAERYLATRNRVHLQAAFHLLDLDGDGRVSKAEMISFYRGLGARMDKARDRTLEIFRMADKSTDGSLDEREFAKAIVTMREDQGAKPAAQPTPSSQPTLTQTQRDQEAQVLLRQYSETSDPTVLEGIFKLFDLNGDGIISPAELQASMLLREASDKVTAAKMLLEAGDLNSDGSLNMEEFMHLIDK